MTHGDNWVPHLLTFREQALQHEHPPKPRPVYSPDQNAYRCYRHNGTPLYARSSIHVHLVEHPSMPGRLGAYEVVGDGWQLHVIKTNVPFGEATDPFLQALAEAYQPVAMLAPTSIIGDITGAPTPDDRGARLHPKTTLSGRRWTCWDSWT